MKKQEKQEKVILFWMKQEKTDFTNRDFFYLLQNYKELTFKDQEECDNLLTVLITHKKINPKRIHPDPGIYKPTKTLEKLVN